MNSQERAAFYKELSEHGVLVYPAPAGTEHTHHVKKVATAADERLYLDGEATTLGFESEEAALNFIEAYIGWSYADEEEVVEESSAPLHRFEATIMLDFGSGPQTDSLGYIESACEHEEWREELAAEADKLARRYFSKEHPNKDWDKVRKQVSFQPCRE